MYQLGGTIATTIDTINTNEYVLPAIQREFVWKPEQIERLFDSLMQGYPFGTFLLWEVQSDNANSFVFYDFMRDYHERDNPHCTKLPVIHNRQLIAVLDGQQRLTALNIGLSGSMATRIPGRWRNNPDAYPQTFLYLNLLGDGPFEDGEQYQFEFLTEPRATELRDGECWFKVSEILRMNSGPPMLRWLNERLDQNKAESAYEKLHHLHEVICTRQLISHYVEKSQDLERVLNIFIRLNSGGTALSYSDLLLSIAVAQWTGDARTEVHALVDDLNNIGEGFKFSKDLVLKAGLMLSGIGNVGFKVENFNKENMQILESKWPRIKTALKLSVSLLASFGLNERTLRADSAILPVAHYFYRRELTHQYLSSTSDRSDRERIRYWFTKSLVKASGIWGSGLDTLLTAMRDCLDKHSRAGFPDTELQLVMAKRGKTLEFTEEEIEDLAEMPYGDKRLFSLMSLLFTFVNVRDNHFHIDHIFPKSRFSNRKLRKEGVAEDDIEEFRQRVNLLPNLQLLDGNENQEKQAQLPRDWINSRYSAATEKDAYVERHLLGEIPESITEFAEFYKARKQKLKSAVAAALNHQIQ